MSHPNHPYGGVPATMTARTSSGTFHLCHACADAIDATEHATVYITTRLPLQSENTRQRCQCEHKDHFQTAAAPRCPYDDYIREALARIGEVGAADPRHIEAYMRLEHGTLDGLSRAQFMQEVKLALVCVREGGLPAAENLAQSFGLRAPRTSADLAECGICGRNKPVCCDDGYTENEDGTVTHVGAVCVDCHHGQHKGAIWAGKSVAGGTYERMD